MNKGKAISPRKIIESSKSQAMTEENKKLVSQIVELRKNLASEEE